MILINRMLNLTIRKIKSLILIISQNLILILKVISFVQVQGSKFVN